MNSTSSNTLNCIGYKSFLSMYWNHSIRLTMYFGDGGGGEDLEEMIFDLLNIAHRYTILIINFFLYLS